jgi:hypothetical protein
MALKAHSVPQQCRRLSTLPNPMLKRSTVTPKKRAAAKCPSSWKKTMTDSASSAMTR